MKQDPIRDEFIRRRMERQKRRRKRRLKVFFAFFMVLLLATGVALSLTVFFPIENLTAAGSKVYSSEQIISVSGIKKGDNLFAISRSDVLNKLKTELPYIETVEFKRKLPGSLSINVKDADEYFCVLSGNTYYTVSKSGWVLESGDTVKENIFEIRGTKVKCKVGSPIEYENDKDSELIDEIYDSLKINKIKTNSIDISDQINIELYVEGRFSVTLGTSNYIEEKVKHLSGMIAKIPAEEEGKINLSMWTPNNTSATYISKADKS